MARILIQNRAYIFSNSLSPRNNNNNNKKRNIINTQKNIPYTIRPAQQRKCYTIIIQNTLNSRIFLSTKFLLLQEIIYTYTRLSIYKYVWIEEIYQSANFTYEHSIPIYIESELIYIPINIEHELRPTLCIVLFSIELVCFVNMRRTQRFTQIPYHIYTPNIIVHGNKDVKSQTSTTPIGIGYMCIMALQITK